jgi:hypothetical protein
MLKDLSFAARFFMFYCSLHHVCLNGSTAVLLARKHSTIVSGLDSHVQLMLCRPVHIVPVFSGRSAAVATAHKHVQLML